MKNKKQPDYFSINGRPPIKNTLTRNNKTFMFDNWIGIFLHPGKEVLKDGTVIQKKKFGFYVWKIYLKRKN